LLFSPPMALLQPMTLSGKSAPFDRPDWIFELKYDGFRSLAVIHDGRTQFISRNGHPFSSFESPQGTDFAICR
jgi:bifunctional non-homologous end joining protein LigD